MTKIVVNTNLVKMTGDDKASIDIFKALDMDYMVLCDDCGYKDIPEEKIISLNSQGPFEALSCGAKTFLGKIGIKAYDMLLESLNRESGNKLLRYLKWFISAFILHLVLILNIFIRAYKLRVLKRKLNVRLSIAFVNMPSLINILSKHKDELVVCVAGLVPKNHPKFPNDVKSEKIPIQTILFNIAIGNQVLDFIYSKILPMLINRSSNTIVVASSKYEIIALRNAGVREDRICLINYPVNIKAVKSLSQEPLLDFEILFRNYHVIINVGRLEDVKGQWYLIRIFSQLLKRKTDIKLVILGEGYLKEFLVKLSRELGLKTFVIGEDKFSEDYDCYFLGFQRNPYKFIANSTLFVGTSIGEPLGLVIIESLALGIPVIYSDSFGPREILAPNTDVEYMCSEPEFAEYGVLMPLFEPKIKEANEPLDKIELMWVDTIMNILSDTELRNMYSKKGLHRALEFDIEAIKGKWTDTLKGGKA